MKFLPPEAEVVLYETVFDDDILDRKKVSKSLSALLDRIEDPLVIALDGRWGTGKSYFLKRWVGAHRKENGGKALTLYFDAFANDYQSDPLVALVSALSDRIPAADIPKLRRLKNVATKFVKPLAKIGLNLATLGAKEALNDLGDAAAEALNGEAQDAVDEFWSREEGRQKAMQAFRDALAALIKGADGADPTPMVIVIDELDRCRPDYALEMLEIIKHFFAVPMVHFVLGVNLDALENSVKAKYGQGIDSAAYLQKFISIILNLPERVGNIYNSQSAVLAYAKHTAVAMKLPKKITDEIVKEQLPVVIRRNSVSIRDVGKILGSVAILPPQALNQNFLRGWISMVASLLIARVVNKKIFEQMVAASLSDDDLISFFDATHERINRQNEKGEQNQLYDHQTMYIYRLWQVILSDGAVDFENSQIIKNQLNEFGDVVGCVRYPQNAHDDYLINFGAPDAEK